MHHFSIFAFQSSIPFSFDSFLPLHPSVTLHRPHLIPHYRKPFPVAMVFTGIVEEMGTISDIRNLDSSAGNVNLTVSASKTLEQVSLGDSVCVNGACLTVTSQSSTSFTFGLAPETLRRTNLGQLRTGHKVNLERSLSANGRFGGHVVQGHIDCTGEIVNTKQEKETLWFTIHVAHEYMKYIVQKGYIAIDGTSLTVCDVLDEQDAFTFMMIAYTQQHVVTATKSIGQLVNIEVDITGKYIERILAVREAPAHV